MNERNSRGRLAEKTWRLVRKWLAETEGLTCRYFFLFVALAFSGPASAASGPWSVSAKDGYCSLLTSFEDKTVLGITLDWRTDMIGLFFFNENWKSLGSRAGGTVDMHIQMSGNVEYDEWFDDKAVISDGEAPGFSTSFAKEHKSDFLASWALADAFTLRADDINLGNFTLRGSKAAILSLAACAGRGLKNDRSDPFAQ